MYKFMTKKKHNNLLSTPKNTANVYYAPASVQYTAKRDVFALEIILAHRTYPFLSRFNKRDIVGVKLCEKSPERTLQYAHAFACLLKRQGQSTCLCGTSNRHMDTLSNGIVSSQKVLNEGDGSEPITFMALDGIYGEHEISRAYNQCLSHVEVLVFHSNQTQGFHFAIKRGLVDTQLLGRGQTIVVVAFERGTYGMFLCDTLNRLDTRVLLI